jgi:hypothetical protein
VKVALEQVKRSKYLSSSKNKVIGHLRACLPFVDNSRAVLIHRPRYACLYSGWREPYMAIHFHCGLAICGGKNITFLEQPPQDKFVCQMCELNATAKGHQTSSQLASRHVHVGGMKAVQLCRVDEGTDV